MNVRLSILCILAALAAISSTAGCHAADGHTARPKPQVHVYRNAPRSVPAHVQTGAYLITRQQADADPKEFAPYLTWAYSLSANVFKTYDAGIKTVIYMDPLVPGPEDRFAYGLIQNMGVEAKDCNGYPIRTGDGSRYFLDVRQPGAENLIRKAVDLAIDKVRSYNPAGPLPISIFFIDSANTFDDLTAMPCGLNRRAWTNSLAKALAGTKYPVLLNTLSTGPSQISERISVLAGRNVAGLVYEHCFLDRQWSTEENAQIQTIDKLRQLHKPPGPGFWCYVNGDLSRNEASTVTQQRLFQYASFLLTYDPGYSVYQTAYGSPPSTFQVLPETQFVPLDPRFAAQDIDQLRTSSGAYVQEFQYCYYRRKPLGSCEIAVNPGSNPVDIPTTGYRHGITLRGNGVLDGGTVTFDAPPTRTLPPQTAAILVH